ncbi:MAG: Rne/Rng family ribonuclease [Defluviitaleaceae bacterium]|nr:Rne/Rng family ribonuclease [Defluviitaleaceae bacterium]
MKRLFLENKKGQVYTALTIDNKLREIYIDPLEKGSLVGQIILGRLDVILPGHLAFVDIGTGKNAMMNIAIPNHLKKGQPVLVQVYKDPTGQKGAYVGQELKHKGRSVILFESIRQDIGISQKITDEKERKRLRKIAIKTLPKGFGVIVRTNAEGLNLETIKSEVEQLHRQHQQIKARAEYSTFPALIYPDTAVVSTPIITDMISDDLDEVWISGLDFIEVKQAIIDITPALENRIFDYDNADCGPLLDANNITPQISAALKKTVQLPCGGFITIEQTEACVVIDVNTGRYTGKKDFRQTVLKTNLEAATEIAWQLVLRNLSGIIIVDFIDMKYESDRSALLGALANEIRYDRIKTNLVGITELGLVQLTRRRTREPLSRLLEQDCPNCKGKGQIQI